MTKVTKIKTIIIRFSIALLAYAYVSFEYLRFGFDERTLFSTLAAAVFYVAFAAGFIALGKYLKQKEIVDAQIASNRV